VDALLKQISVPMLLLWGDLDPWIVPSRAAKIMALYPRWASMVDSCLHLLFACRPIIGAALRPRRVLTRASRAEKVGLQSGHCPHDDTPVEANAALLQWLDEVEGGKAA
jgi:pimeloyl-ACP methyl ester carboxylesterase